MSRRYRQAATRDDHVEDELSAFIDGALAGPDRERVQAHIETCSDCRAGYIELRAAKQLLGALPTIVPPRAFTLTPQMVSDGRPREVSRSFWRGLLAPKQAPRFALGSVLSLALLVLVALAGPRARTSVFTAAPSSSSVSSAQAPAPVVAEGGGTVVAAQSSGQQDSSGYSAGAEPPSASAERSGEQSKMAQATGEPVTAGGISSPTTVSLKSAPPAAPPAESRTQGAEEPASRGDGGPLPLAAAEVGLALLAVAFAAAAVLAARSMG